MSLIILHNAGFFSCCSVRLSKIISYYNNKKTLPKKVDSSSQFDWYKINIDKKLDITFTYFEDYNKIHNNIRYATPINFTHKTQYIEYSKLEYNKICPFINKPAIK